MKPDDDHTCIPMYDADGNLTAVVHGDPGMSDAGPSRRRAVLLDGPREGTSPVRLPDWQPWSKAICTRRSAGPWWHYVHVGEGRYRYAGLCEGIDHDGPGPGEHECCCGQPDCDGRGARRPVP